MDYRVLGALEVVGDGTARPLGGRKQRAVLAVLVAATGRPVAVDSLLQAIYGDDASPNSRATLHTYVSNLRGVLGDVIVRRADSYLLDCSDAVIDADEFERAYNSALQVGSAEDTAARMRHALSMWRGHPYADIEAHGHLDGQITRLNELRLAAIEARVDADLHLGRHREVVAELDALTVEHPFRERLRAMHMLALYRSGRQGDALRAYAHTRVVLVEELGIDPSPDLQELERRILQQDRELLLDVAPTVQQRAVVVADIEDSGWSNPAQRETAFARRDSVLAWAAEEEGGVRLAQKGTAAYAVFAEPIQAVRAARAAVDDRTRVAVDFGDLQIDDGEPVGPPLARAARLVAVANPGQVLMSPAAHDALTVAGAPGWASASLGRFDIVGLDRGMQIFQLVGNGFLSEFPDLVLDRLPPPLPSATERSIPGYELRALLGVGELGEVHRAYQPSVGREVAVRVFGPGMVGHPQFLRRFEAAAHRITRVEHPGVVPLLDYWREPTRAVLVSRLMTGGTLQDHIPEDGLEHAAALHIFETVASTVASSHRRGIVHGRLRPHNVLLDEDGNTFVADFGVDEMCTGVTSFAASAYDAPERLGGVLATPASDIYSLGVLIHQLLGGSAPPTDAALPSLDSPAAAVVERATDTDPRRRHASVEELAADLRHCLVGGVDTAAVFVPTRNPYRGLAAFEQADADDFFGRDRATAEMVAVLDQQPFLLIVGPSGSGKSSAVKAGLLPALARDVIAGSESWLVTEMVPGRSPLGQLAAALSRIATDALPDIVGDLMARRRSLDDIVARIAPSNVVVLVIDQFEELFTETVDDRERRAFQQMLVDAANGPRSSVRIIVTMRADFFDRPLAHPGFADAIKERTVVLGAMTAAELAEAVSRPAAGVGVRVDPSLVDRLTADAALQPGSLPLLQHVMADLFARRTSNAIGLSTYVESGGLTGAIGRQADAIYAAMEPQQQETTRRLFLRLVNVSDEGDDTRRRARRTELEQAGIAADELDVVLNAFGQQRLLTFDRDPSSRTPTVEVAHEALLTEWGRLKVWIDDARADLLARRRLEMATNEWINSDYDSSFLIGGGRLEVTEAWAADSSFALTHDERRFMSTSRAKSERELRSRATRRRRAIGALIVALLATSTLAGVALGQRNRANSAAEEAIAQRGRAESNAEEANRQKTNAETAAEEANRQKTNAETAAEEANRQKNLAVTAANLAEARRLGTQALVVPYYDQALLLAIEGRHLENSSEARFNLLAAIQRSDAVAVIRSETEAFIDLGLTPDGKTLLASGEGATPTMSKYDATTRTRQASIPGTTPTASSAISPDGRLAVMTYFTGTHGDRTFHLHIVDMATFTVVGELLSGPFDAAPTRPKFSPDSRYVAAVTDRDLSGAGVADAVAFVWDVARGGDPVVQYKFSAPNDQRDIAFLPDSTRILVAGADGTAIIDIASGTKVGQIDGAHAPIAISPDGRTLAATTDPSQGVIIGLFDPASGQRNTVIAGHRERLVRLAFSPDGRTLASGGDDHLVMLWDVATGDRLAVYPGHAAGVNALAFSPDGNTLWSGGDDRAVFQWDLQRAATLVHRSPTATGDVPPLPFIAQGMVIAPDGRYVVFPSTDVTPFAIRDVATGRLVRTSAPTDGDFISFSPDGTRYLTVDNDLRLRVWDLNTGAVLADSNGSGQLFTGFHEGTAVFTPDGRNVVALQDGRGGPDQLVVLDAVTLAPVGGEPVVLVSTGRMAAVTPDGRQAVVVDSSTEVDDTRVLLVDLDTRRIVKSTPIAPGRKQFGGARNNTIAPDGRTVGIGGSSGAVAVVDAVTGTVSPILHAHDGRVESITFAPDYASFVTTAGDGVVKLWDASTQHLLASVMPFGPNHRVRASFLAADRLMIVGDKGEIFEWDPRPAAWEAYACTVAGRNLTKAEWEELFPDQAYRITCPQFPEGK